LLVIALASDVASKSFSAFPPVERKRGRGEGGGERGEKRKLHYAHLIVLSPR